MRQMNETIQQRDEQPTPFVAAASSDVPPTLQNERAGESFWKLSQAYAERSQSGLDELYARSTGAAALGGQQVWCGLNYDEKQWPGAT
jgi:hypothetical protein